MRSVLADALFGFRRPDSQLASTNVPTIKACLPGIVAGGDKPRPYKILTLKGFPPLPVRGWEGTGEGTGHTR